MLPTNLLSASRRDLKIPYNTTAPSFELEPTQIPVHVDQSEIDFSGDSEDDESEWLTICVQQPAAHIIAGSIGSKLWDASLLMAAWALEAHPAGGRPERVLEVGAGLGVVGLALAKMHSNLHVTISDNDTAVLRNLETSLSMNEFAQLPDIKAIDFRDFTTDAVAALLTSGTVAPSLQQYAGLLRSVDIIIGADVVYDHYHGLLAQLLAALLCPPNEDGSVKSAAYLVLPDSRPGLADFLVAASNAGLNCAVQRFSSRCTMCRRLRREHDGWGEGASFSLYKLQHRPLSASNFAAVQQQRLLDLDLD
jgi:hypothetical protein